jgi:hypothetical protein
MIKIRNPFYRKTNVMAWVTCIHCAKDYYVNIENIRATNYCGDCK